MSRKLWQAHHKEKWNWYRQRQMCLPYSAECEWRAKNHTQNANHLFFMFAMTWFIETVRYMLCAVLSARASSLHKRPSFYMFIRQTSHIRSSSTHTQHILLWYKYVRARMHKRNHKIRLHQLVLKVSDSQCVYECLLFPCLRSPIPHLLSCSHSSLILFLTIGFKWETCTVTLTAAAAAAGGALVVVDVSCTCYTHRHINTLSTFNKPILNVVWHTIYYYCTTNVMLLLVQHCLSDWCKNTTGVTHAFRS